MEKMAGLETFKGQIDLMNSIVYALRDDLLIKVAEQYLGRPFNNETDLQRFQTAPVIGSTDTALLFDGQHIGYISFSFGYNGDDIMCNQFSAIYQFTPKITA